MDTSGADSSPFPGVTPHVAAGSINLDAFARRYYALFNSRRIADAAALVDPGAVFSYPFAREHFIGRAGYRELTRRWLAGFPDAQIVLTSIRLSGDQTVTAEWVGEGTHQGVLDLPGLPAIPPTGIRATMPMRETIRVTGGLVTASRTDFDPAELARRLGFNISDR